MCCVLFVLDYESFAHRTCVEERLLPSLRVETYADVDYSCALTIPLTIEYGPGHISGSFTRYAHERLKLMLPQIHGQ